MLDVGIEVPQGWPGHKAGQFAFVTSDAAEGAHPYTIASAWNDADRRITFVIKESGDHTRRLREKLRAGQAVTVEGPYGCFTFDGTGPQQIWVGGGIGVTPLYRPYEGPCGPAGFGEALRRDFAAHGLPVTSRFHQELFAMR